jgi:hypothetical protein
MSRARFSPDYNPVKIPGQGNASASASGYSATPVDQRRDMAGGDVAFAASIPGNPADVTK